MSNYIKSTDFAVKDGLLTGNPLKIVSGTEINDEYNAIQTAVGTKADTLSPTLTGVPLSPTATVGTNSAQLATTAFVTTALTNYNSVVETLLQALYPVGTIYTNATSGTNPATLVGFGTWEAFGTGRVLVGLDSSNTLMDGVEETGGSADSVVVSHSHTATVSDPGHTHVISRIFVESGINAFDYGGGLVGTSVNTESSATGITVANSTTGSSGTNANLQPFITVYYWKRTA